MVPPHLKYPIILSILAALVTLTLKWIAYVLTGSIGLLSEAGESVVNLLASTTALLSLWYASRPVDPSHTYGHEKIEYLSSGLEGALICVAAVGVAWCAIQRLLAPQPLLSLDVGIAIAVVAAVINLGVGQLLLRRGRAAESIVLEADGRHLMTDFYTSCAVVVGLGLVWLTNLSWCDPILGLVVAGNIVWTGIRLVMRSFNGLMDHALPESEQKAVRQAIESRLGEGMDYHALRTRQAGSRRFVDFHLLVPGKLSVQKAHEVTGQIEEGVRSALPGVEVTVHIEPIEDRSAWEDSELVPIEQAARRARTENSTSEPRAAE
jgi:cation diffusion facilitator family transporter